MERERTAGSRVSYLLRQEFRYDYPGPIHDLRHRLVVAPPQRYGDQRRLEQRLVIEPDLPVRWSRDAFGNAVASVEARRLDAGLVMRYEAVISRRVPRPAGLPVVDPDRRYDRPSSLTRPSRAMRNAARLLARNGHDALSRAEAINAFVYEHMSYRPGATSVATTAADAFRLRAGVCQDYAQIMLALCRLCGIPARYVSGHLLGEGGTHAWVEVIAPIGGKTRAVGFDPTHARRTTLEYVFVARGRDYADVPPTSGCYTAPYRGEFTTSRFVALHGDGTAA